MNSIKLVISFLCAMVYGGFVLPYHMRNEKKATKLYITMIIPFWVLSWIIAFVYLLLYLTFKSKGLKYSALAQDRVNASLLANAEKETISSMLGHKIHDGTATKGMINLCKVLSKIDKTSDRHCIEARGI